MKFFAQEVVDTRIKALKEKWLKQRDYSVNVMPLLMAGYSCWDLFYGKASFNFV